MLRWSLAFKIKTNTFFPVDFRYVCEIIKYIFFLGKKGVSRSIGFKTTTKKTENMNENENSNTQASRKIPAIYFIVIR